VRGGCAGGRGGEVARAGELIAGTVAGTVAEL